MLDKYPIAHLNYEIYFMCSYNSLQSAANSKFIFVQYIFSCYVYFFTT